MALSVQTGTLTQPGSTGNQTISLASNFDPKAIIMWASPLAAAGTGAHAIYGVGFGTYRGATVQQRYGAISSEDAAVTSDTYGISFTDALLNCHNGTTGAEDLQLELVSMSTGGTSNVIVNWSNLFTTASVLVNYMIIGGSDVTDALVDDFVAGTGSTTQDETVVSGFGKPELLFMFTDDEDFSSATVLAQASLTFGYGKQGEAGRLVAWGSADALSAAAGTQQAIYNNRVIGALDPGASAGQGNWEGAGGSIGQLDTTVANWPTDGFRITWNANPGWAYGVGYLALRLSANVTVTTGEGSAPIAGGLPVAQTLTAGAGNTPRGLMIVNARTATANTLDTSSADAAVMGIGAFDGTNEVWAGVTDDDALGTQNANRQMTNTKVIRYYDMSATPAITSEADGAVSGADFQLSWNDIDATAFLYEWLSLTETVSGGTYVPTGSLLASGLVSGADVFTAAELGVLTPDTTISGADVFTAAETGALAAFGLLSGADVFTAAELGNLLAGTLLAGTSSKDAGAKAGSLIASGLLSGADVFQASELGSLIARTLASGTDVFTAAETGSLAPDTTISGADVFTPAESGSLTPAGFLSGADVFTAAEAGALVAGAFIAGVGQKLGSYLKTGSLIGGALSSGADTFTASETGSLIAAGFIAGSRIREKTTTGSVIADNNLSAADVFTATELGSLIAGPMTAASRQRLANRLGTLLAASVLSGSKTIGTSFTMLQAIYTGHIADALTGDIGELEQIGIADTVGGTIEEDVTE